MIAFVVGSGAELFNAAMGWAGSLIDGLTGGIAAFASRALDAVRNLGSSIANAFTGILQIGSPSKLFDDFGAFTVEGYVDGVVANDTKAFDATAGLAQSAADGFGTPATIQGATAGISSAAMQGVAPAASNALGGGNTIPITVNITGADLKDAKGLGDDLSARMRREMNALLERAS